jgi:hypothetical protein
VSFDIFLQRFSGGDGADADAESVGAALGPYLDVLDGYARLRVGNAQADIYGEDDLASGFMVNHVEGPEVYEALIAAARAGDLVIIPVGCPTAIIDECQRAELSEELAAEAIRLGSGQELQRLIEDA